MKTDTRKPSKKRPTLSGRFIGFRADEMLYGKIREHAAADGNRSVGSWIRKVISDAMAAQS